MNKLEILKQARELITPPEKWTKFSYGKSLSGRPISGFDFAYRMANGDVSCFCALGAIRAAGGFDDDSNEVVDVLEEALGKCEVASFNDAQDTTHADVLQVFDDAIAKLETAP